MDGPLDLFYPYLSPSLPNKLLLSCAKQEIKQKMLECLGIRAHVMRVRLCDVYEPLLGIQTGGGPGDKKRRNWCD